MSQIKLFSSHNLSFSRILVFFLSGASLVILSLMVLAQSNPATVLPKRDYGVYAYIGEQITRGKLPYRDAWESKPPAIFYVNAMGFWLGRGTRWGIFAIQFISLLTAAGIAFMLMQKLWGSIPAWAGTFSWLYGLNQTLEGGNLTEEYPIAIHFFSFTILLKLLENPRNRWLAGFLGFCFGISFLFRPNNAVPDAAMILTFGLGMLLARKWSDFFAGTFFVFIGLSIPLMLTGFYFWQAGLLQDLLNASIFYNLAYSGTKLSTSSPVLAGFGAFGISSFLALAGYIILVFRFKENRNTPLFGFLLALLLGWPMTILFSDPAKRNYLHYFMNWLPFIALLTGLAFSSVKFLKIKPEKLTASTIFILVCALFILNGTAGEYRSTIATLLNPGENGVELRSRTAIYVSNHTDPGDYVLFWGGYPGENLMSRRPAPVSILFYPLLVRSELSDYYNQLFLHDLQENKPILIVDMNDREALSLNPAKRQAQVQSGAAWMYLPSNINDVFAFIKNNYYLDATVGGRDVYRLQGTK